MDIDMLLSFIVDHTFLKQIGHIVWIIALDYFLQLWYFLLFYCQQLLQLFDTITKGYVLTLTFHLLILDF